MTARNNQDKSISTKLKTWQPKVTHPFMDENTNTVWLVADKEYNSTFICMEHGGFWGNVSFTDPLTWAVSNYATNVYVITEIQLCCLYNKSQKFSARH